MVVVLLAVLLGIFVDEFIVVTKAHPLMMGFIKFSILATFGESLKMRISTKSWKISNVLLRASWWGWFGIWITLAFSVFGVGVNYIIDTGLWPFVGAMETGISKTILTALTKSVWINFLGGYAWFMMIRHAWFDYIIEKNKYISFLDFGLQLDIKRWFGSVPKTIWFFWVPAHTITFCLPPEWMILFAACLSVALGALLMFGQQKVTAN